MYKRGSSSLWNKNVYVSSSPRFSSGVVIGRLIVLNRYLVHSCWGLHLISRFVTKVEARGALMGSLEFCSLDCD